MLTFPQWYHIPSFCKNIVCANICSLDKDACGTVKAFQSSELTQVKTKS